MNDGIVVHRKKEMDDFKQPPSLDEVIAMKLDPVIEMINAHMTKVYEDFNKAMYAQQQHADKTEGELSRMVQVLWGIVNEANARSAALETVLMRNGMNPDELAEELKAIKGRLTEQGEWMEVNMPQPQGDVPPPVTGSGDVPPPRNPGPPL